MARERKKAAKKEFQSSVEKAVADYDKALKNAQQTVKDAKAAGNTKVAKEARGLVQQLKDIAPMIEVLKQAKSPTATYTGPITQSAADVMNQTRAENTYGGAGYQPGVVYAREADVKGFEGYSPDQYYVSSSGTGISNTGRKYINGKLATEDQWANFLNNPNAGVGALSDVFTTGETEGGTVFGGTNDVGTGFGGSVSGTFSGTGGTGTTGGTGFSSTGEYTGTTGASLGKEAFKKSLALFFGEAEAANPWVDELYNVVTRLYRGGNTIDESFNIAVQEARNNPALKSFADRFKGIYALQDLKQAGKPVIVPTIGEYVASQAKLADIFTQVNLPELANVEFTGDLIGKGNSVSTIASKIADVYNRIDLAPASIKSTLDRYFPTVDKPTLARTILLGQKGVQQLVDDLAKYEVLAAAEQQGIAATGEKPITGGVTEQRAGEYARMGETYSSIMPKLQRVAQATPTVSKLAGISRRENIGQAGIESAVIGSNAQALEELQRLSEEEEGRFRAKAGRAEVGLASQRRANRAF